MAKGLPYFKFMPADWLTGNICFESLEAQGLFINVCAWYWQRDGKLTVDDINLRYNKPAALVSLLDRYFSVSDGFISIAFLNEQFIERKHVSVVNSDNGSKGGRPKTKATKPTAKRPLTEPKAKKNQLEENKKKNNISVTVDEVINYFIENGYRKDVAEKVYRYYSETDWHDSKGNKVLNWKQKCQAVWFKDENKIPVGNAGEIPYDQMTPEQQKEKRKRDFQDNL
jgi:hypothetical protein